MNASRMLALICASMLSAGAVAESDSKGSGHVRLDETVISGNQELPKVLYIVPWQDPSGIPKIELDPNFTDHEVFRRLYPPAYKRELQYYDMLKVPQPKPE
ncbi:MAG TPA: hypothetical protein VIZ30_07525 [Pseudomonadales bacterium]